MAICRAQVSLECFKAIALSSKNFSTSGSRFNKWRRGLELEPNPNIYGPLRMLPDYSFVDGRPVPLSKSRKKFIDLQQQYCKTINELSKEVDEDLQNYKDSKAREASEREAILSSKLKPKGEALLQVTSKTKGIE